MSATECLTDDKLIAFTAGSLPPTVVDGLSEHLLGCDRCQERLAGLDDRNNPVIDALRRPVFPIPIPATAQWNQIPPAKQSTAPATAQRVVTVSLASPAAEVKVPSVGVSVPKLSGEVRSLLQFRLRIVFVIAFASLSFILMEHLSDQQGGIVGRSDLTWLTGFLIVITLIVNLIGGVLLWLPRAWPIGFLRAIELACFGLAVAYLSAVRLQFFSDIHAERFADPESLRMRIELATMFSNLQWYVVFLCYGLFVPNTWRRCATILGCMSFLFFATTIIAGLANPAITHRLPFMAGVTLIGIFMIGGLALFGSFKISELQAEAFAARQLGQYRLKEKLGAGGMGEVYLAEHRLLKRPCAIKLISPTRASDPATIQRFEREVQATAQLTHPNTVEVFDYGRTEDGTFYYVMEYLPGITLSEWVEREGPLPPWRVVSFLRQLCGALAEAHAAGLVHRDIKPGNVIVCKLGGRDDVVKLLDFGLVLPAPQGQVGLRLTQDNIIMGTPEFMSPEQATGQTVDARSDLYSLGAMAYYLLTGVSPFGSRSTLEILFAHVHEAAPRLRERSPLLPADLDEVVRCCLNKNPAARFQDAASLDVALARCQCVGQESETSSPLDSVPRTPAPAGVVSASLPSGK